MLYIFDIDGVICNPQEPLSCGKKRHDLKTFDAENNVWFVTGNDYKTATHLLGFCPKRIYCDSGLSLFESGVFFPYRTSLRLPPGIEHMLCSFHAHIKKCNRNIPMDAGQHVSWRTPAFINFSFTGRNATPEQRQEFFEKEKAYHIVDYASADIGDYWKGRGVAIEIRRGGMTSLDITCEGLGKEIVLNDYSKDSHGEDIMFFGDKMHPGGNDYQLAKEVTKLGGVATQVQSPDMFWSWFYSNKSNQHAPKSI